MFILPFLTVSAVELHRMKPALIVITGILIVLALCCISMVLYNLTAKKKIHGVVCGALLAATLIVLVAAMYAHKQYNSAADAILGTVPQVTVPSTQDKTPTEQTTQPEETTTAPTEPDPTYVPEYTDLSNPANWGINWEIIEKGSIVSEYQRPEPISFGQGAHYTQLEGIVTFRGDNYRSGPTYGTANVVDQELTEVWRAGIGTFNGWPGSGWTGQPLIVRWDDETKSVMNLYNEKKAKDGLVEVIYATLDGYIYFYDLDDGSYTRDPIWVGMNFKGAGSLDPRGYPLMYVGSGDFVNGKTPRMFIISLVDGSILYEQSGTDPFTKRSDWAAFDSSPLIDAETDTLIWPGESGILYTIKLNSRYDAAAGTVTVAPEETVKTRYTTSRSSGGSYWLGYEPSAVIVDRYLYISENGGMFFCIDLNTMELVWSQDTRDDSNSTPVFQWDASGETGYIYTAPSLHWTASSSQTGQISIYKLNAKTGEIVWEKPFDCHTVSGVSGGVQSTPLLGKAGTELEGLIIYTVARTPNGGDGVLIALDTETGETVWEHYMSYYAWSSPAPVYTEDGKAYIIACDSAGYATLIDGTNGEELSYLGLEANVEASPAVFGNMVVVGTRGQRIYGLKVS